MGDHDSYSDSEDLGVCATDAWRAQRIPMGGAR